jgi:hypothetical protein
MNNHATSAITLHRSSSFSSRDFNTVMRSLSDAWNRADHWATRRQILAIVAADLRSYMIKDHFPGVSDWQIRAARRHGYSNGTVLLLRDSLDRLIIYD